MMRSETDKTKIDDLIAGLPGESLVRHGLSDVYAGRRTAEAYLVRIARPRLSRAGLLTGDGGPRLKVILDQGRAEREPLLSDEEVARELQERRGRLH